MKPKLAFPIPVTPEFNPGDLPENITKFLDLRYACDSGEQVLDLYLPEEKDRREGKKFPLILYIHEGAFAFGSKRDKRAETLFEALKRGYAIASVDYRKSGEVTWPAPLYDIKTAVRFLRAHAERYALDEKKFAVWGMSAGAYYGSMAAVTNGLPGFEDPETGFGRFDSSIQAAVDLCGADEMGRDIFSRLLYGGRASLGLSGYHYFHNYRNVNRLRGRIFRRRRRYRGHAFCGYPSGDPRNPSGYCHLRLSWQRICKYHHCPFHRRNSHDGETASGINYGSAENGISGSGSDH